jgi:excisionase family DNA binding protein
MTARGAGVSDAPGTEDAIGPGDKLYRVAEAAELLGVSPGTVRRWADSGKLVSRRDGTGRRVIEGVVLAELAAQLGRGPATEVGPTGGHSARNRFSGIVTKVTRDYGSGRATGRALPAGVVHEPRGSRRAWPGPGRRCRRIGKGDECDRGTTRGCVGPVGLGRHTGRRGAAGSGHHRGSAYSRPRETAMSTASERDAAPILR